MFSKLSLNTHRVGQFSLYLLAACFSFSVKYPLNFFNSILVVFHVGFHL